MSKPLRIVFMGTPEFAVPSLEALHSSQHKVVCVVTAADKPSGRGKQMSQSAVKYCALEKNIPLLQPEKLRDEQFLNALSSHQADLFVVVAFRMLPEAVWQMPPLGTINLHGSLLPQYRGAAPINWAVINGEKETGVTTFFLQHAIDTGHIIQQTKMKIGEQETVGQVHDRMMLIGAETLLQTVESIAAGNVATTTQAEMTSLGNALKHAPKIFKEDCKIDWNKKLHEVHNFVRGLHPYPAAFTEINGRAVKIFFGKKVSEPTDTEAGTIQTDGKSFLRMACADGWYYITDLQAEGKKRMLVDEFLRGWRP
ncbi:MAG: methionyl-tRNA formyltransferase [Flavobacteriales bacterium]